ncbi:MAG: L,D-transpeptidase catalytic domain [Bacteroidetes bacterium]|nr:L,D-transpeptidase catalytic domain [Bacteroidota bacterium]
MIVMRYILVLCALVMPVRGLFAVRQDNTSSIDQKISALHLDRKGVTVYISKLSHTLTLKIDTVTLKEYYCVFGGNPYSDKKYEGDQCTPEGVFHVLSKYPHSDWEKFIWIDYPNNESWRKFETNKQQGKLPPNATIGGSIGIHGVPNHRSDLIDNTINWTLGCISLRDEDVNEIYNYVSAGTEVIITK